MSNTNMAARIKFNVNEKDSIYHFNIPETMETKTLNENDILVVDTKYGLRFGYFDWYNEISILGFEPEKSLVAINEIRVPYNLDDEFYNIEGFILIEIDGKYLQYNFRDRGLVGILNHMITNNIASACIKTTPKDFEPATPYKHFNVSLLIVDADSDYKSENLLCKFTANGKVTLLYYKEFDTRMTCKLGNSVEKSELKYFKDMDFNIDCKSILTYGRDIYDIIDNRMKMNSNIISNYYHAFRDINGSLLNSTESTFGYIINENYESADVFEFRSTPDLGVYIPYFILNHEIDGTTLGQGYIDEDEDDDYVDENDEE